MASALYDPDGGYYSHHVRTVGARGDFTTSPVLDNALATAIALWIRRQWKQTNAPRGPVIEIGAGDGSLAEGIITAMGILGRRQLRYYIVETSPRLEGVQRERLGRRRNVRWHSNPKGALDEAGGEALIISNELVDAFPATVLEMGEDKSWREVTLHHDSDDGRWVARPGDAYTPAAGSALPAADYALQPGQWIERHDSYFEWLAEWLPAWRRGEMLTIDYGDQFPALYHRRPRGTLRAYFAQHRYEELGEILARPGRQDLTADVDFTDLAERGTALGLAAALLVSQAEFIASHAPRRAASPTADPHGPGGAFRVLQQSRTGG